MPTQWWECRIQVAASGSDRVCTSLLPDIAHGESTLDVAWKKPLKVLLKIVEVLLLLLLFLFKNCIVESVYQHRVKVGAGFISWQGFRFAKTNRSEHAKGSGLRWFQPRLDHCAAVRSTADVPVWRQTRSACQIWPGNRRLRSEDGRQGPEEVKNKLYFAYFVISGKEFND